MKKLLFLWALLISTVLQVNAQTWQWVGEAPTKGGDFYIYHANSGKFLNHQNRTGNNLSAGDAGNAFLWNVNVTAANGNDYTVNLKSGNYWFNLAKTSNSNANPNLSQSEETIQLTVSTTNTLVNAYRIYRTSSPVRYLQYNGSSFSGASSSSVQTDWLFVSQNQMSKYHDYMAAYNRANILNPSAITDDLKSADYTNSANKTAKLNNIADVASQSSKKFANPIIPMDAADPTVLLAGDGYYYMCCSEHKEGEGLPLWRSADMINWTKITNIFPSSNRPAEVGYTYLWAPELAYVNGKYVLYYANAAWGNEKNTQICVATSDNPYGPFENNKVLINASNSDNGALNANVDNVIDPSLFRDTDGKNYLIWGSWHGIHYVELDASCTGLAPDAAKKSLAEGTEGDWTKIEAPMVTKHDGYYYLIASKGTTAGTTDASKITYQLVMGRSKILGGTFVDPSGNNVFSSYRSGLSIRQREMYGLLSSNDYVLGPGHCSQIVTDKNGTDWIFYHGYKKTNGSWDLNAGRVLFASKVLWGNWVAEWPGIMPPSATEAIEMPVVDAPQPPTTHNIASVADWQAFAAAVNGGAIFDNANITADLDFTGVTYVPFGTQELQYHGTIEGNGHKIKNLTINTTEASQGLIGTAGGATTIKNLIIDSSCEIKGGDYTGGFIGHAVGGGDIHFINCGNEAHISGVKNTAGFVGCSEGVAIYWNNCYNTGNIDGNIESAAFSGWGGDKLENCWNTGRTMGCQSSDNGWLSLVRSDINNNVSANYVNSYDLNDANASNVGKPAGYDKEWLADGHLAMTMGNTVWMQKLGVDAHPYPFGTDKVYEGKECGTDADGYTNNADGKIHKYTFNLTSSQLTSSCTCGESMGVIPVVDGYLQIGTADQLEMAMEYVTNGGGANAKMKLTSDIDFTAKGNKMFGQDTDGKRFTGEFDGQFNKVTVCYNDGGQRTALFRIIDGATVKNLTVDGSITMKDYNMAGGIFGTATNSANIEKCISAVTYNDLSNHDATFGGLGANTWTEVKITDCAFVGKVNAARADGNGGLVGYDNSGSQATFTNCYVAADINWKGGDDYMRNSNESKRTNCHKLNPIDATLASGEFCYDVIGGDWTQNLGEDAYPVFNHKKIFINGTYANVDETIELDENKSFATKSEFTTNVNMKRTLKANSWNTFCVPFDMENSELGEGAEVKELTGLTVDGEHFTMTFTDAESIKAGKPYMVRVPNALSNLNLGEKTVKGELIEAEQTVEGGMLKYIGVYNSGKAPMGSFIISNNNYYLVDSDVTLKAYRGYISAETTSASAKSVNFLFGDNDETAIEIVETTTNGAQTTITFDLSGRRVQKVQKGIYIINGKKIVK